MNKYLDHLSGLSMTLAGGGFLAASLILMLTGAAPPADPAWADASGVSFLEETVRLVRAAGWDIANVAVQVVGNRPVMAPRRAEAERVLSAVVGAPVSVSATSTDGLGFPGRTEGVAAVASALLTGNVALSR